jgi:uroporphyrin-III C-methyltransferase/precorrin-2 dehydrogenase/sirohydrochlorin ferrochelatase
VKGFVSLVGAGPGAADLLTLRAARRLAEADLVLYDALVDPAVLALAPRAKKACVGKRAGRHSFSQETIERLLVRRARRGERVVRLKCGDPFVFGRGGEEALALAAAGVPCEVVPGISTSISAAALAGIPVTHRGLSAAFVVVSGHAESAYGPVIDTLAPGAATLVVLMGVGSRALLAQRLLARGWAAQTPAALLFSASHPGAFTWRGALGGLAAGPEAPALAAHEAEPGVLVIGAVAGLALPLAHPAEPAASAPTDAPLFAAARG